MPANDNYVLDNNAPVLQNGESDFWYQQDIDPTKWDQSYPYQLLMLEAVGETDKVTYKPTKFRITLPIGPQDLGITMPFATKVEATLNGISEQHGGAPFRDIVFSGTTGITPIKNNATPKDALSDNQVVRTGAAIFAGTVSAAQGIINDVAVLTGGTPAFSTNINKGLGQVGDFDAIPETSTGYYQFRLLQQFLESYAELKKKNISFEDVSNTKNLRLALAIWKDEAVYLCTGVQFQLKRTVANPMEYFYTLQLKAWKRISPSFDGKSILAFDSVGPVARKPNFYAQLLTRMNAANEILQGAGDLFKAVVQDPQNVLNEITRQVSLFLKRTSGVVLAMSDLPNTLKNDMIPTLTNNWDLVKNSVPTLKGQPSILNDGIKKILNVKNLTTELQAFTSNQVPPSNIITQAEVNDIFNTVKPSDLPLPSVLIKRIDEETQKVLNFNRLDFELKRDQVKSFIEQFSDAVGLNTTTYNLMYNRTSIPAIRTATEDDFNILWALNEVLMTLDHLAASGTIDPVVPNSLEYVAGLAERSGIAFTVPTAKFAIPFPYGGSLERLAAQYLGDPDRWHEIAVLNGLRAPYIDEEGFSLSFLTNGSGNTFSVSDKTNLYPNQTVYISSNTQLRSTRHITEVKEIYPGYVLVSVDGDNDLINFTVADRAVIEAFLPGTVNSQQLIYIPSNKAAPEDPKTKAIPGINAFDPLLQVSGIDLLLTQSGDLALTPDGDCKLAYGLQNIVQTVKLALTTPQGTLLHHPEYGIPILIGQSTAEVSAKDIAKAISRMFTGDPTFSGVKGVEVNQVNGAVNVKVILDIVGSSSLVPISFSLINM